MNTMRPASPADAAVLAKLHAQCFAERWSEDSFLTFLERDTCLAYLGAPSGTAIESQAFILVQIAATECEILTLGVLPEARRCGMARDLVRHAARAATARGATEMFLDVADDNMAARSLYEGLGFAPFGSRRNYYRNRDGSGADALLFRIALPLLGH